MFQLLLNIFYSGYNASPDYYLLDELSYCLDQGFILYESKPIADIEEYHNITSDIKVSDGPGLQGKGHMALKNLAQKWLSRMGKSSRTEVYFAGLHPDLIADDQSIVIECGTTDPGCLSIYFSQEKVKQAGILPFPSVDQYDLNLHMFTKTNKYLSYFQLKHDFLKKKINKIRP